MQFPQAKSGKRRFIAIFLLTVFLLETVFSTVSYALTSGPTAPEATSFEPIDTTDMVSLVSGDFTYNMPLLEVPGPGGSYPLSLSYHAGIQPNEDASWVGLGWTLNPGSLTRLVNGYADDLNGANVADRTFWEGGETVEYSIGISVGLSGGGSVSAGLSFSHDTYLGFGRGLYLGGQLKMGATDLSMSGRIGVSPYGNFYTSTGMGLSIGKSESMFKGSIGLSVKASMNGVSAGMQGGISAGQVSLLNASISTSSSQPSLSVGGMTADVNNSKEGKMSTFSEEQGLDIPLLPFLSISLSRSYARYWSDETEVVSLYGSLFMHSQIPGDTKAFDAYSSSSGAFEAASGKSADKQIGATFADYDMYSISAQGVAGSIRPYHYSVALNRQNIKNGENPYEVKMYSLPQTYSATKVEYHFVNDFSNRVTNNPADVVTGSGSFPLTYPFYPTETGLNDGHGIPNVPGSKHVEYYTNDEMTNFRSMLITRGFLDCTANGFDRTSAASIAGTASVGGFRITNSSGVNYHFSLPAYSYDEHTYTENKDHVGSDRFNHLKNANRYAYTWYLTAVTGPDFVDRNANGVADQGDWGYWVSFEYGKWSDRYQWRNPGEGFNEDGDYKFRAYSKGKKELYFLNKIKTQTHSALFVKEIRHDGKGATSLREEAVLTDSEHRISYVDEGGYAPKRRYVGSGQYATVYPVSQLKLKSIHLLKNEDVPLNLESATTVYNHSTPYPLPRIYHLGSNVLDVHDFALHQAAITSKSIRSINLDTDYSLATNLPNSYLSAIDVQNSNLDEDATLRGKLTLKGLEFYGKAGASIVPPTRFEYDIKNPASKSGAVMSVNQSPNSSDYNTADIQFTGANPFHAGDIVRFKSNTTQYFALVRSLLGGGIRVRPLLGQPLPTTGTSVFEIQQTKNPPYHKDAYDIWQSYKSDAKGSGDSYNQKRLTSKVSALNTDAWSLRTITTELGATIQVEYESDSYSKSVYHRNYSVPLSFQVKRYENGDPITPQVRLRGSLGVDPDYYFTEFFQVGQPVDLIAVYSNYTPLQATPYAVYGGTVESVSGTEIIIDPGISDQEGNVYHIGNLYLGSSFNIGGGIRVKSISLTDGTSPKKSSTSYEYLEGATSYEPVTSPKYELNATGTHAATVNAFFKQQMLAGYLDLITMGRDIPGPGVMYGKVNVRETFTDASGIPHTVPGYSQYKFRPYQPDFVKGLGNSSTANIAGSSQGINYTKIRTSNPRIQNFTQAVGELMSVTLYDNNNQKLNETINHYLIDQAATVATFNSSTYLSLLSGLNNQGIVHEVFDYGKFVRESNGEYTAMGIRSKKETYPSIPTGSTTINYKSGITSTTKNIAFDFYSGEVLSTLTTDGYGNTFLTEALPAYKIYPRMGPKDHIQFDGPAHNAYNKQMITQVAGSTSYKVADPVSLTKLGVVSSTATTWSDLIPVLQAGQQVDIWRQKSSYSYVGTGSNPTTTDGILPVASFTAFGAWNSNDPITSGWQKDSEITLYDPNSHALEAKDLNDDLAASKMSLDHTIIMATIANAGYNEFAYCGVEEAINTPGLYGGGVTVNGTKVAQSHTGASGVSAALNSRGFSFTISPKPRTYVVSVWSSQPDATIKYSANGGAPVAVAVEKLGTAGAWNLLEGRVVASSGWTSLEVWCESKNGTTVFDDFRVAPLDAGMTSYVYNAWGELSHILDAGNLFTEFQYDGMGRLLRTYREVFDPANTAGKTKLSEQEYNYGLNGTRLDANLTLQTSQSITATVTYGHAPYHYAWYANNTLLAQSDSPSPTSTFNSPIACPHLIRCEITDAHDGKRTLEATAGSDNLLAQFSGPDQQQVLNAGTSYQFTSSSGGVCGPYTLTWTVGPIAGPYANVGSSSTLNHTFSQCGYYRVTCSIQATSGIGPSAAYSVDYYVSGGSGCIEY